MIVTKRIHSLPVKNVKPGDNDRTVFDPKKTADLAANIKKNGLAQPITVRKISKGQYEIVAGERRYRAVCLLGRSHIDAIVSDISEEEASAVMLSENTARENLDPIDEARAFRIRLDKYNWTLEDLSERSGRSVLYIQVRLKLLTLRDDLQSLVRSGNLLIGYAQILADGNLDVNRQSLAVKALRENPRPTPGWFRGIVNQYAEQQNTVSLFDTSFLVCQELPAAKVKVPDPAHPQTTIAPIVGNSIKEILSYQVTFWRSAAAEWDRIGKPFKRQECEAAAWAIENTANQLS